MNHKFENLTSGIAQVYKKVQKIKKMHMNSFGLKGTHVMCIYFLSKHSEGITAAEICELCGEDKAGISRILAELEALQLITYPGISGSKKYRAKAMLTESGLAKAESIRSWIRQAENSGSSGITEEEEEIFYRILFRISDNLDLAISYLEEHQ